MLFFVNMLIKTDSTVICVPFMLEHVCYEPFSFKKLQIWKISYVNLLNFVYCLKFMSLRPDFNQINENLRLNVYAHIFWEHVYKISYP